MTKDSYNIFIDKHNSSGKLGSKTYILAIQSHKGLTRSKSQELESGFHAMKLGDLRLNFIQNAKQHWTENFLNRKRSHISPIISETSLAK